MDVVLGRKSGDLRQVSMKCWNAINFNFCDVIDLRDIY